MWLNSGATRNHISPFVAAVLETGERLLWLAPRTTRLIEDWPGNPGADALAMRFNAALHAIARRGTVPELSALYRGEHRDFEGAIAQALSSQDGFIADWLLVPPQTNEVGRAGAIWAALMAVQARFGLPVELLELGCSAGLNLNLADYAYDLGGVRDGVADSPVRIVPEWRGPRPGGQGVRVISARGADLCPLDPGDPATRERLRAYVWADRPLRADRLEAALDMALRHPPEVEQANAADWLERALAAPQAEGRARVVFHSMSVQYFREADRAHVADLMHRAGQSATEDKPLARIGFEWTPDRGEVRLTLTLWPDGESRTLATCHPYGDWIDWRG